MFFFPAYEMQLNCIKSNAECFIFYCHIFYLKLESYVFILVMAAVTSIMFIVFITPIVVTEFSHF